MALFSKEKRVSERERLLSQELKSTRYSSLSDAMVNEVSLGSTDSKLTTVELPGERVITIITVAGKVVIAKDSQRPVDLENFLYWTDLSSALKDRVLAIADGSPLGVNVLEALAASEPDSIPVIHKALLDSSYEALLYLSRNFHDYSTIDTELFRASSAVKELLPQGIDILELEQLAEVNAVREEELLRILTVADIPWSEIRLSRANVEDNETYLLEKRFILAAAEAEASLEDTYNVSGGFRWVTVLQRLHELTKQGIVSLKYYDPSEALPSEISIQRPHEVIFHLTLDIEDQLDSLVESVFSFSGDIDVAKEIAAKNRILEERIFEIEDWIIRELAGEDYKSFDDLPEDFQLSLRGLIFERIELNEKRASLLNKLGELIIDDAHSTEDDLLREKVALKLRGISLAVDHLPQALEPVVDSGFHLQEEKPEFNFNDGRIVQGDEGVSQVEHVEDSSELEDEAPSVPPIEAMLKLALEENPLTEPEPKVEEKTSAVSPIDFDLLEAHIAKLGSRRKRSS